VAANSPKPECGGVWSDVQDKQWYCYNRVVQQRDPGSPTVSITDSLLCRTAGRLIADEMLLEIPCETRFVFFHLRWPSSQPDGINSRLLSLLGIFLKLSSLAVSYCDGRLPPPLQLTACRTVHTAVQRAVILYRRHDTNCLVTYSPQF